MTSVILFVEKIEYKNVCLTNLYGSICLIWSFLDLWILRILNVQEARVPFQVWVTQKNNGLPVEEGQSDGEFFLWLFTFHF